MLISLLNNNFKFLKTYDAHGITKSRLFLTKDCQLFKNISKMSMCSYRNTKLGVNLISSLIKYNCMFW